MSYGYQSARRNAGSYPAQSNAWSSAIQSCWWQATYDGVQHLCATQGMTLLKSLEQVLGDLVPTLFQVNGITFTNAIDQDGNFGPHAFAALIQVMENFDIPSNIRDLVASDYARLVDSAGQTNASTRNSPVSNATMQLIVFVAVHRALPWSAITIPANMVTVHFAEYAPNDGGAAGDIVCVPMSNVRAGTQSGGTPVQPGGTTTQTPGGAPGTPSTQSGMGAGGVLLVLGLIGLSLGAGAGRKGKRGGL